ncbi:HAD-like domain-containing protein [Gamsiella multidivaricata]|uniref:HAD-like domain-containing protein n=1 Tax=Gamsiella multidivaricata TaxID=101098 RepID=UPI00221FCA2C|nr:HAD-like domain-containing protein [Gamsiella multidivaricata]KAI7830326.1 HAD-like domain-containing protein [Gamsiella multidivaricata]
MIARLSIRAPRTAFCVRRLHTQPKTAPFNIVFDIDGVLIKGKQVIPQTRRALELLWENNVPYIFLTNGGGVPESEKAEELSKKLGVPVNPDHLIVSHSPMRSLVPQYKDSNILVVGGKGSSCKRVAESYGFRRVVTPEEVHAVHPSACPISFCEARPVPFNKEYLQNVGMPVEAVMVFHDSVDWGRDLQICLDALASKGGALGTIKDSEDLHSTKQSVPIYFSNPDVVWSNEYPVPRFGQGTFKLCLEKIYKNLTGQELEFTTFGKPMTTTYQYAETLLNRISPFPPTSDGQPSKRTVYAVGDNPYADIAGANAYGWDSVLVKTGVFRTKGYENHHVHPATAVVDHVEDAVRWIFAKEKMKAQEQQKQR